jgi:hypothetical protein
MENHPTEIACLWYSMEDNPKNIIRNYMSNRLYLTVSEIMSMGYKVTKKDLADIHMLRKDFSIFEDNIEFIGRRSKIKSIRTHYRTFSNKHAGKFVIVVIDNIMKLLDYSGEKQMGQNTQIDDYISSVIGDMFDENQEGFIILIHHFTKDQFDKKQIVDAYRPNEVHFRGSASLLQICTQVVTLNRPYSYPDLVSQYKDHELYEVFKHLNIIEVTKNRNVGKTGIIRQLCNLNYKLYQDLDVVYNNVE